MPKFNAQNYELQKSILFTCKKCSKTVNRKLANDGCPLCGYFLFKVSTRSGTPGIFDPDKYDPYARQKRGPFTNDGSGYNLTKIDDEHWLGSGLGGRFRGEGAPKDFSSYDDEYDRQREKDIPGSMDDLIHDGDFSGARDISPGDFLTENDALSSENEISRDLDGSRASNGGTIDERLRKSRIKDRVYPSSADNLYRQISKRQRGNIR